MQTKGNHNYYVYIITNTVKTVLYIGMTNDLQRRLNEHYEESGKSETFREGIIAIIYFIMNGLEMLLLPLPERNN